LMNLEKWKGSKMTDKKAELKITVIDRKIETRWDAFSFGLSHSIGLVLGASVSLGILILLLKMASVLPLEAEAQ
jgi:hypothetical protein